MVVEFDSTFLKNLQKIKDQKVKRKVEEFILIAEKSDSIRKLPATKKLKGFRKYYRHRIGDFRLGFEKTSPQTILLIVIQKREDIYKNFP
jgi:mRNA interferase RelE/StbE